MDTSKMETGKMDTSKMDLEYGYRQVDKEHLSEFLGLYRSLPLLWDTQDKDYYNKFKKTKAYTVLLKKYQEKFPHATENDVKKRLNALRTNFRKELRKVVRYLKMGEVYEPKLWYYNELSFLKGMRRPHGASAPSDESMEHNLEDGDITEDFEQASTSGSHNDQEDTKPIEQIDVKPRIKHKSKQTARPNVSVITELTEQEPEEPYIWYQEPIEQNNTDNCYYWAQAWAADLRKMDATQRIYAKKAIAEILMEGQLGQLHRNSVRINS